MVEKRCHALCIGLGIHFPYIINTSFSQDTIGAGGPEYFNISQREAFSEYLDTSLSPALASSLEWLDGGHRCSFSVSGLVLEQALEDETGVLDLLVQAMNHRYAEILGQTYYHSIAGLFADKSEFGTQVNRHAALMKELSGRRPTVFENTEFMFTPDLADVIRGLGFAALYSEGYDHILSAQQPNESYSFRDLTVLIRNCRLSEDLAYRFFDKDWDRYPLTPEKYSSWVAGTPGNCIHVFIDARTFSGKVPDPRGFRGFFSCLPEALLEDGVRTMLPSDTLEDAGSVAIPIEDPGMCSPDSSCSLAGIQNMLQQSAFWCLEDAKMLVVEKEPWRRLQTTDHFIRMGLRSGSCGRVVSGSTNHETLEYFSAYLRVLGHLESTQADLHSSRQAAHALRCLPPEYAFHFSTEHRLTGYSAHSITEFSRLLEFVPENVFLFHQDRGDFARWIADVLGDTMLAEQIQTCTGPAGAQDVVESRIRDLWTRLG